MHFEAVVDKGERLSEYKGVIDDVLWSFNSECLLARLFQKHRFIKMPAAKLVFADARILAFRGDEIPLDIIRTSVE